LRTKAEPLQLTGGDRDRRGLAGADLVEQADGRLGHDPRDRGALSPQATATDRIKCAGCGRPVKRLTEGCRV
jgi:hypothetical protein